MPVDEEHELETLQPPAAMEEEETRTGPSGEARDTSQYLLEEEDPTARGSGVEETANNALNGRVKRKLDWILLPFLAVLFLLNSLDKSNIGNAETAGFTRDAGLSADDLNISLAFFFAFFVTLQPVGAAFGRKYGMARWVPACMSLWGLCTLLHIWVRRRWQLIVLRIAIATLEAGFYPTTVSYLSLFYTRYEFAVRLGFFYGQTAVAGVLGGILSWAVFSQFENGPSPPDLVPPDATAEGEGGLKSWAVLFLIEGCTTMGIAILGFFWLPHSAESAWFFNQHEKRWAERRIKLDRDEANGARPTRHVDRGHASDAEENLEAETWSTPLDDDDTSGEAHHRLLHDTGPRKRKMSTLSATSVTADAGLSRQDVLSAILNYNIWHLLVCNILSAIPATAFGVFLPLVVKQLSPSLNLSPAASNLLSAPPFAFGAVVLFIFTRWSDHSKQRLVPILWGLGILLIGLLATVIAPMDNYVLRYISLCILLSGSFIASPLTVAWLTNNTPEPGKRAILLGLNGWGNLAGVFSALLFRPEYRASGYIRPLIVTLVCVIAGFAGFIAFWVLLVRENKWRDDVTARWTEDDVEREELMGDVSVPSTFLQRLWHALGLESLARWLGVEEGRKGDEKLTWRYSM